MSAYKITIAGKGPHHSGNNDDADKLSEVFIKELRRRGHDVDEATITHKGEKADQSYVDDLLKK